MLTTKLTKTYTDKIHENVPCPLCDAYKDVILATEGYPNIPVTNVICTGCGLIRVNPRMTPEGYEEFYKQDFFEYLNPYERPSYVEEIEKTTDDSYETPTEKRLLPYLRPYVKNGASVLDIGAGFGQTLYLLQKEKGINYIGIEPDPFSRQVAKEKIGIDLQDTTVERFLASSKDQFDLIILDQTFEHLLQPLETLKQLAQVLKPEGVMYIGVPNAWNPQIAMNLFYQIAHTYNYTPATMKLFADKAGLKIISVRDPEGYPLEVMMARKDSSYPEERPERMTQGAHWKDTLRRLKRKERVNKVRAAAKKVSTAILGTRGKEYLKKTIDSVTGFKY